MTAVIAVAEQVTGQTGEQLGSVLKIERRLAEAQTLEEFVAVRADAEVLRALARRVHGGPHRPGTTSHRPGGRFPVPARPRGEIEVVLRKVRERPAPEVLKAHVHWEGRVAEEVIVRARKVDQGTPPIWIGLSCARARHLQAAC